jgi:predicted transcriptional regulator
MADNTSTLFKLTASIVSAYVRHNSVPSAELPALIERVHTALMRVSRGHGELVGVALRPAIPANKSIVPDYIICLEDGKKFKSLRRHLRTHHNLTPEQYREKWGLGRDYPMVPRQTNEARPTAATTQVDQLPLLASRGGSNRDGFTPSVVDLGMVNSECRIARETPGVYL